MNVLRTSAGGSHKRHWACRTDSHLHRKCSCHAGFSLLMWAHHGCIVTVFCASSSLVSLGCLWSASSQRQSCPGHDELKTAKVSETVRSSLWWQYANALFQVHNLAHSWGAWLESCPCHDHWQQLPEDSMEVVFSSVLAHFSGQCVSGVFWHFGYM